MSFDAQEFINATSEGPMSTSIPQCPEGVYTFVVDGDGDIANWFREIEWKDKKTGADKSAPAARIPCVCTDDGVKRQLGREKVVVGYDFFLDMKTGANGKKVLDNDEGKNVKLGQLREALGQNNGPFQGFMPFRGAGPFLGKVSHRSDPKDPSIKYAQIDRVTKLA